jgi:hypothetical protein
MKDMSGPIHDGLKADPYFGDGGDQTARSEAKGKRLPFGASITDTLSSD